MVNSLAVTLTPARRRTLGVIGVIGALTGLAFLIAPTESEDPWLEQIRTAVGLRRQQAPMIAYEHSAFRRVITSADLCGTLHPATGACTAASLLPDVHRLRNLTLVSTAGAVAYRAISLLPSQSLGTRLAPATTTWTASLTAPLRDPRSRATIPEAALDVRVAKVWRRTRNDGGAGAALQTTTDFFQDLLLRDDLAPKTSFVGGWSAGGGAFANDGAHAFWDAQGGDATLSIPITIPTLNDPLWTLQADVQSDTHAVDRCGAPSLTGAFPWRMIADLNAPDTRLKLYTQCATAGGVTSIKLIAYACEAGQCSSRYLIESTAAPATLLPPGQWQRLQLLWDRTAGTLDLQVFPESSPGLFPTPLPLTQYSTWGSVPALATAWTTDRTGTISSGQQGGGDPAGPTTFQLDFDHLRFFAGPPGQQPLADVSFDDAQGLAAAGASITSSEYTPPAVSSTLQFQLNNTQPDFDDPGLADPRGSLRTLIVKLTIPPTALAGRYEGVLSLQPTRAITRIPPVRIPISVRVLPARLPDANRTFMISYSRGGARTDDHNIQVELLDMKNHGLNAIKIGGADLPTEWNGASIPFIDAVVNAGLDRLVVNKLYVTNPSLAKAEYRLLMASPASEVTLYGQDEANGERVAVHGDEVNSTHDALLDTSDGTGPAIAVDADVPFLVSMIPQTADRMLDEDCSEPDHCAMLGTPGPGGCIFDDPSLTCDPFWSPEYSLGSTFLPGRNYLSYAQYALDGLGKCSASSWIDALGQRQFRWNESNRGMNFTELWEYVQARRADTVAPKLPTSRTDVDEHETSYFQLTYHRPVWNRYLTGNFLATTQLRGTGGFTYAWPEARGEDPFLNENQRVVYPSTDGPIPTLKWEGIRAGTDDYRSIQHARTVLARLDDAYSCSPALPGITAAPCAWSSCMQTNVEAQLARFADPIFFDNLDRKDFQGNSSEVCYLKREADATAAGETFIAPGAEDYDRTRENLLAISACAAVIAGAFPERELLRLGVNCEALSNDLACTWP
jgi:hypothetical protein